MSSQPLPPAPTKGITLDKPRTLRCDLQGMRLFNKETGISLLAGAGVETAISRAPEMVLPALVWAFAVHEDPTLTVDYVAACLNPGNVEEIAELIVEMIADAMPDPKEETEGDPQKAGSTK